MTFYLSSFFSGLKSGINSFSIFLGLSWWDSICKGSACSARNSEDSGLIPGSGRSPGRRNGNPLQYSWLKNPIGKGVWWVAVHGVAKSWIQLSNWVHMRAGTHTPTQSLSWPWPFWRVVVVQSQESWLFVTPWTAECQALSFTISWSLLRFMSIEVVDHLYLTISSSAIPFSFCFQSFPASGSFPGNWLFTKGGQSIEASASASVLPMNIQGWIFLGSTSLISLQSKGLPRVFSNTTI